MKKTGFTLAEVLITLAIVGLIAALTLPGLNSNVNNRRIGPALAKAINNLENANRMILVENEVGTLNELGDDRYIELLAEQLNCSFDGETATLRGKDGIVYNISAITPNGGLSNNKYSGSYYIVGIDINGDRQPDRANSDRFAVIMDTRGPVIPAGGSEEARYFNDTDLEINCANGASVAALDGNSYGNCTSSIINAGWEVNYLPSAGVTDEAFSKSVTAYTLNQE